MLNSFVGPIAHITSLFGVEVKAWDKVIVDLPLAVFTEPINCFSILVFSENWVLTAFPESSTKFAASAWVVIAPPEAFVSIKLPLLYTTLLIVAFSSWSKYTPAEG